MALAWEWQDRAACRGAWPPVDMLDIGVGESHRIPKLIEGYCNHCPVVLECAEFALTDIRSTLGIWGGVYIGTQNRHKAVKALRLVYTTLTSEDAA